MNVKRKIDGASIAVPGRRTDTGTCAANAMMTHIH